MDRSAGHDEEAQHMRTAILAGGRGSRLGEETEILPKPMVEIGDKPILWHIMRHYARHGHTEFFIALGYKGEVIKRYFLEYHRVHGADLTVNLGDGRVEIIEKKTGEDWVVHLTDTGMETLTGGRVKRLERFLREEPFMLTYGDGVSNVDVAELIKTHRRQGKTVTITAVRPPARFGGVIFDRELVRRFTEKPQIGEGWINGGFMVCEPGVFDYLDGDETSLEGHTLERLAADGQLAAYRHDGFWQCMDTPRDKQLLAAMWGEDRAPWRTW